MASTRASISKASKRPKINIIPPKQLFVDLTHDDTKTPSPTLQLSSPSAPKSTESGGAKLLGFAAALAVLVTGASQSKQHESHHRCFPVDPVDTSLIHLESRKSPTAELFDVDSGRVSIHHKDIKGKKSKNKQKPTRNEETSTRERYEERYQSRISPTTREESQ
ncbi:hypothetical protein Tco_0214833 [Tanacetum coccineum]